MLVNAYNSLLGKVGELGTQGHISGHIMSLRSAWPTRDPISTNKQKSHNNKTSCSLGWAT